ncbi:MAG: hypothetical protein QOJ40_1001 [Verrucomicrobiota bacterium]
MEMQFRTRPTSQDNEAPALEIRFQFVDGSGANFFQPDPELAENIWSRINAPNLFARSRIVIADDYSKSVFLCSQINRLDFVFEGSGFSQIPNDHADLVEMSEKEFQAHVPLDDPARLERRAQPRQVGDLLVSFLHLRMRGGSHVYLMNETLIKLPVDNLSFMQRLLSGGSYGIRLQGGGQGFLNLSNLLGYSVYPGVPEIPNDTWMALSSVPVPEQPGEYA